MSIGIHQATVTNRAADHQGYVQANGSIPNTSGGPTVSAYLLLEATDNYVCTFIGLDRVITYNAADINAL